VEAETAKTAVEASRKTVIDNSLTFAPVAGIDVAHEDTAPNNVPNPKREAVALRSRIENREKELKDLERQHVEVRESSARLSASAPEEEHQALDKRAAEIRAAIRALGGTREQDEKRIKELTAEQARRQRLTTEESRQAAYVAGGGASGGAAPEMFAAQLDGQNSPTDLSSFLRATDMTIGYRVPVTEGAGKTLTQGLEKTLGIPAGSIRISGATVVIANWPHTFFADDHTTERQVVWKLFRDAGEQSNAENLKRTIAEYIDELQKNAKATQAGLEDVEAAIKTVTDTAAMRKNLKAYVAALNTQFSHIDDPINRILWERFDEPKKLCQEYLQDIQKRRGGLPGLEKQIADLEATQAVNIQIATITGQFQTVSKGLDGGPAGDLTDTYQSATKALDALERNREATPDQQKRIKALREQASVINTRLDKIAKDAAEAKKKAADEKALTDKLIAEKKAVADRLEREATEKTRLNGIQKTVKEVEEQVTGLEVRVKALTSDGTLQQRREARNKIKTELEAQFKRLNIENPLEYGAAIKLLQGRIQPMIDDLGKQIADLDGQIETKRKADEAEAEKVREAKRKVDEAEREKARVAKEAADKKAEQERNLKTLQESRKIIDDVIKQVGELTDEGTFAQRLDRRMRIRSQLGGARQDLSNMPNPGPIAEEVKTEYARTEPIATRLDTEIATLQAAIKKEKEDADIKARRERNEQRVTKLEGEIDAIVKTLSDDSGTFPERRARQRAARRDLEQKKEQLESERGIAPEQLERINKRIAQIDKQLPVIDSTITELEIREAETQLEDIYLRYRTVNTESLMAGADVLYYSGRLPGNPGDPLDIARSRQSDANSRLRPLESELTRKENALRDLSEKRLAAVQALHRAEVAKIAKDIEERAKKLRS
jgi:DNA repair exonuclease SbcCD ATPase subunit